MERNSVIKKNDPKNIISKSYSKRPWTSLWVEPVVPKKNAFHNLQHKNYKSMIQIISALTEGNGIRGTSRIFGIDKNTVLNYLERAAYQCRCVTNYFVNNLYIEELQLDEMWSFVFKKEKNLTQEEYLTYLKGDQWFWIAMDVRTKVIVQYELGKRTYKLADDLIGNFKQRTNGQQPSLVTSDGYKGYELALLKHYGDLGKSKQWLPPEDMDYVIVLKKRKKGKVVDIKEKVIFGSMDRAKKKIKESPVSKHINVAFIERCNLSRRHFNQRLSRKTIGFSKILQNHLLQFEIESAVYNFVRSHRGIGNITPMMAAGKTDHIWSLEELLSFSSP